MVTVSIESKDGKEYGQFTFNSVEELQKAFHAKYPKLYPDRQRFVIKGTTTVLRTGGGNGIGELSNGSVLVFKDLGPQVGYRTVFLVEYGGPLVMHLLFFFFPQFIYPIFGYDVAPQMSLLQTVAMCLAVGHYAKRELESVFVHRFSNGTMPFSNLFRNSAHYWILGGIVLCFPIYAPTTDAALELTTIEWTLVAVFVLAELGNLHAHIVLRNLRPAGTRTYEIPHGGLFALVSCPNYFFESLAWACFAVLTRSICAGVFWVVGTAQMMQWALDKHRKYRETFKAYPRRKAMFPFVF